MVTKAPANAQWSTLAAKGPAHTWLSSCISRMRFALTKPLNPAAPQTASEASPVPCLREQFKYDTAFRNVDYVSAFEG